MTPDVNVLVAASRTDHPHHEAARAWLEAALNASAVQQPLAILPMVAAGFVRLVTHPKVFREPTPIAAALEFMHALLDAPGVYLPALGQEWPEVEPASNRAAAARRRGRSKCTGAAAPTANRPR